MSAWHLRAVVLPDGSSPVDLWIDANGVSETPVAGAIDVPGVYVLFGGLVDAHFHATLDFEERGLSRPELLKANLAALSRAGVLAARDMGQPPDAPWLLDRQGPRFTAARTLLVPPGRYFPGLGEEVPPERLVAVGVSQARAGAAWVKVVLDFPGDDGNWFAAPRNYSPETLAELVRAVHAEGARVAVHTTGPAVADAVRAGGLDRARPVPGRRDRGGDGPARHALGADVDGREPPERAARYARRGCRARLARTDAGAAGARAAAGRAGAGGL